MALVVGPGYIIYGWLVPSVVMHASEGKHVHTPNANSLRVHTKKIACNMQQALTFG